MNKKMVVFIVMLLTVTMLAACASDGSNKNNQSSNQGNNAAKSGAAGKGDAASGNAGTEAKDKPLEKHTFKALLDSNATFPYTKEWPIWAWIEERTGVTLDVQTPSGKLNDTLNLVVASNDLPDLMYMPNRSTSNKFGQQGALVNILEYLNHMPNMVKWMEQYPEEAKAALAADGNMYMFPNQGFGETNRMIWMYRADVFEKHGLTLPANYDELHAVLKQLKELYPDSYPLTTRFGQIPDEMYTNLSVNFGSNQGVYYDFAKGEWKYGPTEGNYKAMVEDWHTFYEEGLIPPDFLTIQTKQWQDMVSNGEAFITIDYISRIDFFNNAMRKDNPDYNMQFMAPPAGITGGEQHNPYFHYLEGGLTVASTSDQIENIMAYMDFFYTEEGRTMASWGVEGETYVETAGQKAFKPEFTDVTEMRKQTGLQTYGTYTWIDFGAHLSLFSEDLRKAFEETAKYDPNAMQPRPAFTEEENEVISVTGQAVKKARDENFAKFVVGTRSLSEWDQYVGEIEALGVQKLIDTYTKAYDRVETIELKVK